MTRTKKQRDWLTPLSIPQGREGGYAIEHIIIPAGQKVLFNNARNIFLGNQKGPGALVYDIDTRWHKLTGPTGTWMTDLPVEQRQIEACLKGMKGRILVGGLGLGLAAYLLAKRSTVTEVAVVEISREVINLVKESTLVKPEDKKIAIFQADLFQHLKNTNEQYTYAFYDIWQSDSEGTFFDVVLPLIELSKSKVKHPPVCWNEDVMRGQLFTSIQNRLLFLRKDALEAFPEAREMLEKMPPWERLNNKWHDWKMPYFQWWKETRPNEQRALQMAHTYAGIYGSWNWQDIWNSLL